MKNTIDLKEISLCIEQAGPGTRVYLGSDSEVIPGNPKQMVDYHLVVVVHLAGKHGCKIFGRVDREHCYDRKKDKPSLRLMTEVYKVAALFIELAEVIPESVPIEVHVDISTEKTNGSSHVAQQALGYVFGVCGVKAKMKPESFAASSAADQLKRILG